MAFRLVVEFPSPTHDDIHRIRNFGEDLFRQFQANAWAEISIDGVDRATDRLIVTVRQRKQVRRVEALIQTTLARHQDRIGAVSASVPSPPPSAE